MTTPNEPQGAPSEPPPPPWGRSVSRPQAAPSPGPSGPPKAAGAPPPKGAGAGAPPPKGLPAGAGRLPRRDLSDWKRHVLLRVGAPPFELKPDVKATIGRADDCELAVPSTRVSRRHAEVFWKDGRPHLKDLGSQNGTLVNGKRIAGEHALQDADEIEVGPFLCTYKAMPGVGSVGKTPGADANALTQPMLADAMAGRLDQMSLQELLQTLDFNKKTGTLEVFGTDGADGSIVVRDGAPIYAKTETRSGEEAIYELLLQKSGQFSLSPDVDAGVAPNVERPMMSILLEAGRRLDEAAGASPA